MGTPPAQQDLSDLHLDLIKDVSQRGLEAVFASRGREVVRVSAGAAAPRSVARHFADLVTADPRLVEHVNRLSGDQRITVANALRASPVSTTPSPSHGTLAQLRTAVTGRLREHPDVQEGDGNPVQYLEREEFRNWGQTIRNVPALTFIPRTKTGIRNIVRWAAANGLRVRAAGYRHSWSDVYSADGEVLVSMLPLYDVEHLPSPEPPIDSADELQGIEVVGTVVEDGTTRALCRIGAATTNEQFRRWCLDEGGGNWAWTIPLNVIMVEITWGGSNAPICHGAGRLHPTLSDLVAEIEFVNAKAELQVVSDPVLLRVAAGCFGLLGIVTSLTLKLDPMSYATLRPETRRLALAVPPPAGFQVPAAVDMTGIGPADLDEASSRFADQCENDYYAEWFWFPFQKDCWVNCWRNDGARAQSEPYPGDWGTLVQQTEEYLAQLASESVFRILPGRLQAELFGALAMANLPGGDVVVTPLIEALHFRRGIQNFRVLDMELEIPVPARGDDPARADWSVCQQAWWAAIANVLDRSDAPMRVALEMRIMGGSAITMAPQHGNALATCSIEVLTTPLTAHDEWVAFMQDIADGWTSLTDHAGSLLNVRPHWAKQWQEIQFHGRPAVDYLRDVAYRDRIPEFRSGLRTIAAEGGYEVHDLALFGNRVFDTLLAGVFD